LIRPTVSGDCSAPNAAVATCKLRMPFRLTLFPSPFSLSSMAGTGISGNASLPAGRDELAPTPNQPIAHLDFTIMPKTMDPRLSFVTLGVADFPRARQFYEDVLRLPRVNDSPDVVFFELGKTRLALVPRDLLAADAGVSAKGSGFTGFTLAHNGRSAAEVIGCTRKWPTVKGRSSNRGRRPTGAATPAALPIRTAFRGRWPGISTSRTCRTDGIDRAFG